jgi:hypothetical protein
LWHRDLRFGAERIAATLKENGIQGTGLELNVTSDESVAASGEHSGAVRCAGDSGQ